MLLPGDLPPMDLFLGHLKLEEVFSHCCRRAHFKREEAEDFGGHVKCRFIEDDYAILRQYQGKSSIRTYLTVVIRRLLLDYQDHLWGKWRPLSRSGPAGAGGDAAGTAPPCLEFQIVSPEGDRLIAQGVSTREAKVPTGHGAPVRGGRLLQGGSP